MPRNYHHYRRPTLSGDLPRRHCATCGKESETSTMQPYSADLRAPKGIAAHYGLLVCSACRAKASGIDESSAGKRAEDAAYLLRDLRARESALLGEEPSW